MCANLVCQLSASPLVSTDTFLVLLTPLLLHHQICLELPHLDTFAQHHTNPDSLILNFI